MLNLMGRLKRLERALPCVDRLRLADLWPDEWSSRLALAAFDAHAATFNVTGDDELAQRAMDIWTEGFLAELGVNPEATRPRLSAFTDVGEAPWPKIDDDDADGEADTEELDRLIAQAVRDREVSSCTLASSSPNRTAHSRHAVTAGARPAHGPSELALLPH
jgi:hypothetical protein